MALVEVKTAELIGPALDWVVDAIESGKPLEIRHHKNGSGEWIFVADEVPYPSGPRKFSTDWSQGGPLIEKYHISVEATLGDAWYAWSNGGDGYGPSHLISAMRCLVDAKLGDTVQIPSELIQ